MVDAVLFWTAAAVYVAITLYLAYFGYKKTKKGEDFLLAGRKVNPWIIGLSYGSTFISTAAIVGFGGVAANWGMSLIWLVFLNIAVGILIAFIIFGKPSLAGAPWNVIDPLVIAIPVSIAALAIGWYYEFKIRKPKPAPA
jgi:Na+/pantothenate symporter